MARATIFWGPRRAVPVRGGSTHQVRAKPKVASQIGFGTGRGPRGGALARRDGDDEAGWHGQPAVLPCVCVLICLGLSSPIVYYALAAELLAADHNHLLRKGGRSQSQYEWLLLDTVFRLSLASDMFVLSQKMMYCLR